MATPYPDRDKIIGPGKVFKIALPLVISSGIYASRIFCDRMMLAWRSETSIAATLSAGMAAFMLVSFFIGVVNYANAFVAQYFGAGRPDRVGLAVWQAILFGLAMGPAIALFGRLLSPIFRIVGHQENLAGEEEAYFLILTAGAFASLVTSGLMCFWTGRGKTWTVAGVGLLGVILNLTLNWALIFGAAGCDRFVGSPWPLAGIGGGLNALAAWLGYDPMGIMGAGLATIASDLAILMAFLILFLRGGNRREFGTWPRSAFDPGLSGRLFRFGFGNGMQMLLDVGSFAVFTLLMSGYGDQPGGGNVGAASGIALSIHALAFIPMIGLGITVSTLVGRGIGAGDIPLAVQSVRSSRVILLYYLGFIGVFLVLAPELPASLFFSSATLNPATLSLTLYFIRLAGLSLTSDCFFVLYSHAIRGAGDTRFSMLVMGFCGWFLFALPCLASYLLGAEPGFLWLILLFYSAVAAGIFYWRYRGGKWKGMRVIE
ncbi:MAG: MATE family efflux transporter [Planctomycetota bacterium]|jgi:MATE family multidrug resistance protein|nr:MATE family efflux transporter [Planctomycetota bacterium]